MGRGRGDGPTEVTRGRGWDEEDVGMDRGGQGELRKEERGHGNGTKGDLGDVNGTPGGAVGTSERRQEQRGDPRTRGRDHEGQREHLRCPTGGQRGHRRNEDVETHREGQRDGVDLGVGGTRGTRGPQVGRGGGEGPSRATKTPKGTGRSRKCDTGWGETPRTRHEDGEDPRDVPPGQPRHPRGQ